MRLRSEETVDPISLPDSEPATGPEPSAFTPPESLMIDRVHNDTGEIGQTPVAKQRMNFNPTLREQFRVSAEQRLGDGLHLEVYQIARAKIQSMAEGLQLDSGAIGPMLCRWLFASEIPETAIDSDAHWREIFLHPCS
jgi:hypothetical protein